MFETTAEIAATCAEASPGDERWSDADGLAWDAPDDAEFAALMAEVCADGSVGGESFGVDLEARLRHAIACPVPTRSWLGNVDPERLDAFHRVLLARAWESQRRQTEARYQQVLSSCLTPTEHDVALRSTLSAAAGALEDYARAEELRLALGSLRGSCTTSRPMPRPSTGLTGRRGRS